MKATQHTKLVSLTTALGIFLVGCGGGPKGDSRSTGTSSTTRTTSNITPSTTPSTTPTTSGGSGSVGFTGNETIDQVYRNQMAQNGKLDQILSASQSASKNSKSSKDMATIGMAIGAGALGLMLLERFKASKEAGNAYEAANGGKKQGVWKGLGNFLTNAGSGGTTTNYRANVTDQKVGHAVSAAEAAEREAQSVGSAVVHSHNTQMAAHGGTQSAIAGTNGLIAGQTAKIERAVEIGEDNGQKLDSLATKQAELAAATSALSTKIESYEKASTAEKQAMKAEFEKLVATANALSTDSKSLAAVLGTIQKIDLGKSVADAVRAMQDASNQLSALAMPNNYMSSDVQPRQTGSSRASAATLPAGAPGKTNQVDATDLIGDGRTSK